MFEMSGENANTLKPPCLAMQSQPALRHGMGLLHASASVKVDGCKGSAQSGAQSWHQRGVISHFQCSRVCGCRKRQVPHCVPVAKKLFLAREGPAMRKAVVESHAGWRREDTATHCCVFCGRDLLPSRPYRLPAIVVSRTRDSIE